MTASATSSTEIRPIANLRPNPLNPRDELHSAGLEELADSIRAQGVLQPLLVTPGGEVVAGHRRLAAARLAGLNEVPVIVRDLDQVQQQEIMLVENLQRLDRSCVEEARAYRRRLAARPVSLGDLADLFRTTCCACGAQDLPTYCAACPMLDLVNRVLARAESQ